MRLDQTSRPTTRVIGLATILGIAALLAPLTPSAAACPTQTTQPSAAEVVERPCDTPPPPEETAGVQRPKKRSTAPVSPSLLREFGPIHVKAVISCEGKLVHIELPARLPKDVCKTVLRAMRRWSFRPASLDGKPVATDFRLALYSERPNGPRQPQDNLPTEAYRSGCEPQTSTPKSD